MRVGYVIEWRGLYLDHYTFGKDTTSLTSFGFDREFGYANFFATREEAQTVADILNLDGAEILGVNTLLVPPALQSCE